MKNVIIVGAGPAGTATAIFLAKKGVNALLLEKEKFPRDKVCGDSINYTSIEIFKEMGVYDEILKQNPFPTNGVFLASPSNIELKTRLVNSKGLMIERKKLDYTLVRYAVKLGVELAEEFLVTQPIMENNQIIGIKGVHKGKTREIRSKIVVAADGTNSIIAKKLSNKKLKPKYMAIAIRTYYENVKDLEDLIEIHYEKTILPAYGWIFPTGKTSANVGVGIRYDHYLKMNKPIKEIFSDFIKNNSHAQKKLNFAKMTAPLKVWPLLYDSHTSEKYRNGILFTGDAASLIDPLTGQGIPNALLSGKLAAQTILNALEKNDFSFKTLKNYETEYNKLIKPNFQAAFFLHYMMGNSSIVNYIIKKAKRNEELSKILTECICGNISKNNMLSLKFLKYFLQ